MDDDQAGTATLEAGERRGKSADAFRTISEVSAELDVAQHVLRFWETRFSQIRPLKRAGKRRYYRPDDVALLRRIRQLLYEEGYTIRGVQKLIREKGVRAMLDDAPDLAAPPPAQEATPPQEPASAAEAPGTGPDAEGTDFAGIIQELEAVGRELRAIAQQS